eukprot:10911784-Alexandrium_andersonii.AAC.1
MELVPARASDARINQPVQGGRETSMVHACVCSGQACTHPPPPEWMSVCGARACKSLGHTFQPTCP